MARLIFLDSEPLGLASQARGKPKADACRGWLQGLEMAGARILVPEIVDYEVRRELVRVGATAGLRRLDGLLMRFPLLPLDWPALLRAAELWALVRRAGVPTADPHALDADAILAGQALTAVGAGNIATVVPATPVISSRFPGIDAPATGRQSPESVAIDPSPAGRGRIEGMIRSRNRGHRTAAGLNGEPPLMKLESLSIRDFRGIERSTSRSRTTST